jgi:hypothetical protein
MAHIQCAGSRDFVEFPLLTLIYVYTTVSGALFKITLIIFKEFQLAHKRQMFMLPVAMSNTNVHRNYFL